MAVEMTYSHVGILEFLCHKIKCIPTTHYQQLYS